MTVRKSLTIIGRAELVHLLDAHTSAIPAKVDTGADISSVWASDVQETESGLTFTLFDSSSSFYNGQVITLPKGEYRLTRIANSFGTKELRYVVKLRVEVKGRIVKTSFSLADRSLKTYPILLGRRLLKGKFLVDVSLGEPLAKREKANRVKLEQELKKHTKDHE